MREIPAMVVENHTMEWRNCDQNIKEQDPKHMLLAAISLLTRPIDVFLISEESLWKSLKNAKVSLVLN